MASKMAGRRRTFLNNQLGTLLILCALAICATTEKRVVGWLGQDVRLPCDNTFTHAELLAMYWMNSSGISKVSFFRNQARSFDDRFNLNEDFSMVITSLKVSDEDVYSCHVELESGQSFTNDTTLAVYAPPTTPYIDQCAYKKTGNKTHSLCNVENSTGLFNLECRVTGYRPNITLQWTSLGVEKQPVGEPYQWKLPDGTWGREVSISVTAKPDEEQNYTCTVRGEATNGTEWSATIIVLVQAHKGSTWTKIVFPLLGVIALIVLLVIYVIFLKDILKLKAFRNKIKNYTFRVPGASTSSIKAAHIGVYGHSGAGKSSFINSIEFALTGKQSQPVSPADMASGGHTGFRRRHNLTKHIALFDKRGMKSFSTCIYLNSYINEITKGTTAGVDESASLLEEVHCPVFVYKREIAGIHEAEKFLDKFAGRLRDGKGYTPMVVVTHAKSLSRDDEDELKDRFSKYVRRDDIWCFENYTNTVESRQRSIQFLEFLKAALHHCEVSVMNKERQKQLPHGKNEKPKQEKQRWYWRLLGY